MLSMAEITYVRSFEPNRRRKLKWMVHLKAVEAEVISGNAVGNG